MQEYYLICKSCEDCGFCDKNPEMAKFINDMLSLYHDNPDLAKKIINYAREQILGD